MKKAIIFLSFTSSQNQSVQNCIHSLGLSDSKETDIFMISNASNIPKIILESNRLQLCKISHWKEGLKQIFLRQNKQKLNTFIQSLPKYNEIEVSIPHFLNILCNYFYHHCMKKLKTNIVTISLYPDGMLSYQPYTINSIFHKESFYRWMSGWLFGMPFTRFTGQIADPYFCVKKIYSYIPKLTIPFQSNEIVKIKYPRQKTHGENVLILGHFNQTKFNLVFLSQINKMILLFQSNKNTIYYKPHPRMSQLSDDIFYQSLLNTPEIAISLLQDKLPVESLIKSINATTIIASVSTALINLKLIFSHHISCYYFGLNKYILPEYTPYYKYIFESLSIKPLTKLYE